MAYTRVNWQNSPSHATPLSAENLNVMDAGIASLDAAVGGHTTSIGTLANLTTTEKSTLVGAINEVNEDVSDVKEDLGNITITEIEPEWVTGKYIDPTYGNVGTSSSFNATEYTAVQPFAYVRFYSAIAPTAGVAFYDENKYFISGYTDNDLYKQRTLQVPDSAYFMRYSCRSDYYNSRYETIKKLEFINILSGLNNRIGEVEKNTGALTFDVQMKLDSVTEFVSVTPTAVGGITRPNNVIATGTGYGASTAVSAGEFYKINGRQFSGSATDTKPADGPAYVLKNDGDIVKVGWIAEGYFSDYLVVIPSGVDELVVNLNSSAGLSGAIKKAKQITPSNMKYLFESVEEYPNLANLNNVILGYNWVWGSATNRAVLYVPVKPNKKYYISVPSSSKITKATLVEKGYEFGNSINSTGINSGNSNTITTTENTRLVCVQFEASSDLSISDFVNYDFIFKEGEKDSITTIDAYSRETVENYFETFHDMAMANRSGESRIGGYVLRNKVENPQLLTHKQEAWGNSLYYDVNSTVKEYDSINYNKNVTDEYIANYLPSEEIDFTPADGGFTRIIMGKSTNDVFFVSYVASDRTGSFGDADKDSLEITTDFVNFTTILRGASSSGDGVIVPNKTFLKVQTVKEFSDGSFLIPIRCKDISTNEEGTHFYKLSADYQTLTHCEYENLNGDVVPMVDEFNNPLYDWHFDVKGAKGLLTTYGSRQPSTDYGRVWYTEDCGNTWKQIFQMTNHYQDGVDAGTTISATHMHGVAIDPYADRLYIIAGEDNRNIFWSDKGLDTTDSDWNVIPIRTQTTYQVTGYVQVVGGYAFKDGVIFGSDATGVGCEYRLNKLDNGGYSKIEPCHEFLPNYIRGTTYCAGEQYRRDNQTPLLFCMTRENAGLTEAENETLNDKHRARVVASYDGFNFKEIWKDDTYDAHTVNIDGTNATRNFAYCTRGMNCYLLKNGDAIIKYSGRDFYYFGGDPLYSVIGYSNGSCKVRKIIGLEKYL